MDTSQALSELGHSLPEQAGCATQRGKTTAPYRRTPSSSQGSLPEERKTANLSAVAQLGSATHIRHGQGLRAGAGRQGVVTGLRATQESPGPPSKTAHTWSQLRLYLCCPQNVVSLPRLGLRCSGWGDLRGSEMASGLWGPWDQRPIRTSTKSTPPHSQQHENGSPTSGSCHHARLSTVPKSKGVGWPEDKGH